MKTQILVLLLFATSLSKSQTNNRKTLVFSGYTEFYYSYDFSNSSHHEKPNFIYNYKKDNELSLNLAYAKASYEKQNIRANLALMAGDYARYNLATEPNWAKMIYEANMGIRLSKKNNVWLDLGIMPSHIGFDSNIGADCWMLTRSIAAENSPYYQTGVGLSYSNQKLNAAVFILNGWQHIRKPDFSKKPSAGVQIKYKPNDKITLNYSNFIGSDKPDSLRALRTFHNLYALYQANAKLGFTFGLDIGTDKYNATDYGIWYSPVFITRYSITPKSRIAARLEYFMDPEQIMISTFNSRGFQTLGTSFNYDFVINDKMLWRTEAKFYQSKEAVFENRPQNVSITTALTLKL